MVTVRPRRTKRHWLTFACIAIAGVIAVTSASFVVASTWHEEKQADERNRQEAAKISTLLNGPDKIHYQCDDFTQLASHMEYLVPCFNIVDQRKVVGNDLDPKRDNYGIKLILTPIRTDGSGNWRVITWEVTDNNLRVFNIYRHTSERKITGDGWNVLRPGDGVNLDTTDVLAIAATNPNKSRTVPFGGVAQALARASNIPVR